ncbi:MAG: hypothetical protein LBQ39_09360 [Tannerellaceae bacterium]|jgi:hypothetical protein|nr:hypothetical protein [Tannerellaceae bacterium]
METDALKASWGILNERLAQSEILNKRIIKEMIASRTRSAHENLLRSEVVSNIALFLTILIVPLLKAKGFLIDNQPLFILVESVLVVALVLNVYLGSSIFRFNIETMKLNKLTECILTYKLWYQRAYWIAGGLVALFLVPILFLGIFSLSSFIVRVAIGLAIGCFGAYFLHIHSKKNITAIEKGLEELKELEKELIP